MRLEELVADPRTARGCPVCGQASPPDKRVRVRDAAAGLFRCADCRAVYWSDLWDAERVREHYGEYYPQESAQCDPLTQRRYHALLERLERSVGVGRILDVGCGAGHLVAVAESRGWDATGLEVSASGLACLERLKRERGLRCQIVSQELERAGVPERSMDLVTMIEVLEHLTDPMGTLRACHRILRDGAPLYLTTPNYDSLSRRLLGGRWRVIADEHRCLFSPRLLGWCLQDIGFVCTRVVTKNIDVPHLLAAWRSREGGLDEHPVSPDSSSQKLRHTVESVGWLRGLKHAANGLLRLTGLGDTIEVMAVKR